MPTRPRSEPVVVEIGASLVTDYDRGHDLPWRVCRRDGRMEACWRFTDPDAAWLFSVHVGQYFSGPLPPEAQADRYATKLGGLRETAPGMDPDKGEGGTT